MEACEREPCICGSLQQAPVVTTWTITAREHGLRVSRWLCKAWCACKGLGLIAARLFGGRVSRRTLNVSCACLAHCSTGLQSPRLWSRGFGGKRSAG